MRSKKPSPCNAPTSRPPKPMWRAWMKCRAYRVVKAPFAGVDHACATWMSARWSTTGSTLLYRIAQTGTLRTYVNVPQTNASSIHAGQPATAERYQPARPQLHRHVARTANSLDPTSRTLLVEVQVPNPDGALLPGMYAQVDLSSPRANAPAAGSRRRPDRPAPTARRSRWSARTPPCICRRS